MKRLFIVTIATLMASASFAGTIKGESAGKVKEAEERLKEARGRGAKAVEMEEVRLLDQIVKKLESSDLSKETIQKSLVDLFDNNLIKKLEFESALSEAKLTRTPQAQNAARYAEVLLNNLGSGLTSAHKTVVIDALQNYASLLVGLSPEAAAKYESQMRYLAANTHISNRSTMLSAEHMELVSIARIRRQALGIDDNVVLRSIEDLKAQGSDKIDKARLEVLEYKRKCGKQG